VRISHKVDYGVRAALTLAERQRDAPGTSITGRELAEVDGLPPKFVDDILRIMRAGGIVRSARGTGGGWSLARPAAEITVADVIRAIDGPLASVRGVRPHELGREEPDALVSLWIAVRAALRQVLEQVTLADLASGDLPPEVRRLVDDRDAWQSRDLR